MKRWTWLVVVPLCFGLWRCAWAATNDVDVNQAQRQAQDQDQHQTAVAAQAQGQSSQQANGQSVTTNGQQRDHVQSSPVLYLGQAQEGLSVGTPWGNTAIGKQAEVTKIVSCGQFIAQQGESPDTRVAELENLCVKATKRCGLLCQIGRLLF